MNRKCCNTKRVLCKICFIIAFGLFIVEFFDLHILNITHTSPGYISSRLAKLKSKGATNKKKANSITWLPHSPVLTATGVNLPKDAEAVHASSSSSGVFVPFQRMIQQNFASRDHVKPSPHPSQTSRKRLQNNINTAQLNESVDKMALAKTTAQIKEATTNQISKLLSNISQEENEDVDVQKMTSRHCNNFEHVVNDTSEEGRVPTGYTLINIHILIRHGDRTNIYHLPNVAKREISCNVSDYTYLKIVKEYLDKLAAYWRNWTVNDKFHLRFSTHPNKDKCHEAKLTGKGAVQHLLLGRKLRDIYSDKLHLLDKDTSFDDMYLKSTEYSRTWQSATAFLYGFLPVYDPKRINFKRSDNLYFCSKRYSGVSCNCPMTSAYHHHYQSEYREFTKVSKWYNNIKKAVGNIVDIPAGKVPFIGAVLDVLWRDLCHEQEPPCNTHNNNKCFTWDLVKDMILFNKHVNEFTLQSNPATRMNQLLLYPMLKEIVDRFINITNGSSNNKFSFYSGHDKTIAPLAQILGFGDGEHPPYASRIVFEFYKKFKENDIKAYYIKIIYNGVDKTKRLLFCPEKDMVLGLCPFVNFIDYIYKDNMGFFTHKSYNRACNQDYV